MTMKMQLLPKINTPADVRALDAAQQHVPITNYGVILAALTGILPKVKTM